MKNKTIKTYQEITVEEAAQLQREGWQHFRLGDTEWEIYNLDAISHCGCKNPFYSGSSNSWHPKCAKFTEIDPCKAPDGCPELEPWMAYVGMDVERKHRSYWAAEPNGHGWVVGFSGDGTMGQCYAIDVRTEWAQEHFPEHCRIRNYQEPDAFLDFIMRKFEKSHLNPSATYYLTGESMKELYELGQANTTKGTK